ncbi:Muniscin C-terminal mu homology domain-domain-containing protein [Naematelia encephala]|uniref:Muniscin C-terminal mu homology domain-domain-containing protein n=1 Tax=Naematelia encephala TaxID=71784 RepID=A0A1Y2AD12_9TREE|nr:Muniscin C-terminal mu homology domain-domain-containing protein [Naematelia encephala]
MASDTLPDDAWVQCFLSAPPRPLLGSLQRRLQGSTTHVNALAELFKQRAAIEQQYAESLSKLARTAEQGGLSGKAGNDWEKGGGEARLWESVITDISETSASHSTFSAMIKTDFEQPLRDLPNKIVAWRRIGDQDASLEKTLKEYEKTSAKLEKASSKTKSSKTDVLSNELNQLTQSLSSLSPMVYTTYQRLDEERLRGLKEVVVRWGTVRGDMSSRDGERAERAVAGIIGWETTDEVLAVGRRLGGGRSAYSGAGNAPTLSSANTTPRSVRRQSSITGPATPGSDFSPRPAIRQNGSSGNVNSNGPSSFAGGLKSMLGRKGTIARGRSNSNATSTRSGRDPAAFNAIGEEDDGPLGGAANAPPVDDEGFSVAPADRHRSPWDDPDELEPIPNTGRAPLVPTQAPTSGFSQTFSSSPAASAENLTPSSSSAGGQPRLNLAMTSAPIQESEEERQAALAKMQQTLAMPPQQPSRRTTIARGRRDVRNTMFGGVSDDGGLPRLSTGTVLGQETLADSPTGSFSNGGPLSNGAPRQIGRRASQSSVTSNNPFDSPGLGAISAPVLSGHSTESGLRASLSETVNVIIRGGQVQRVQINGEIHVSLRVPRVTGPIHIRLTSFEQLEKIAPNPVYLAQVPDRPGEYFLNSEVLANATSKASAKGTLLFKYQVHVPSGKESLAVPILLEPAFQAKEGETRMILTYSPNSTSTLSPSLLNNLTLAAAFSPGVSVNNVQAKPAGGVWSPATRRMTWSIPDAAEPGKIMARFVTDPGEALVPQGILASWSAEGVLGSGLGVEVVQSDAGLGFEEVNKGVVTGKYIAEVA